MTIYDPSRAALLSVRCPHCHAGIGQRCTVPSNGRPLAHGVFHQSRHDAATVTVPAGAA